MEKEYIMKVAGTIREQLMTLTPISTIFSWGIDKFIATVYNDMPALKFKVNGRLHKGNVIVALNGSDYYEVYLQNATETILISDEVCFNELGDLIEEHIESGTDKEEYDRFCKERRKELLRSMC